MFAPEVLFSSLVSDGCCERSTVYSVNVKVRDLVVHSAVVACVMVHALYFPFEIIIITISSSSSSSITL